LPCQGVYGRIEFKSRSGWAYLHNNFQIISIYYAVKALEEIKVPLRQKPFDFDEGQLAKYETTKEIETARFVEWKDFSADCLTLPIDKLVAEMVTKKY
jgi:8-oxo-dGTP diphosphatase